MGSLFKETAEHQPWLDRAKIDQTVMNIYMQLGQRDEKLKSTYQQVTNEAEARKQKIRSLSWATGVAASQLEYKDLIEKACEYSEELEKEVEN